MGMDWHSMSGRVKKWGCGFRPPPAATQFYSGLYENEWNRVLVKSNLLQVAD
jgi:hypothetical protein